MKLKTLKLESSEVEDLGLKEFNSSKFNSIIALVGKNGSGKSRYLKAIQKYILNSDMTTNFSQKFSSYPIELNDIELKYTKNKPKYDIFKNFYLTRDKYQKFPQDEEIKKQFSVASLRYNSTGGDSSNEYYNLSQFVQKEISKRLKIITQEDLRRLQPEFNAKEKVSFQDILDSTTENSDINEFGLIAESSLTFLKRLPHKLAYDEIDCRGDEKKFKSRVAYKRYKLLYDLISEFLGKELEWHSKSSDVSEFDDHVNIKTTGYWTINKKEFDYNQFSDGEKVLFTYAILLFLLNINPRIKFKESIIIIDEPELNLHPKAQIQLIKSLENLIGESGQIIIATHSLSILSNLDYSSIFLVRDNELFSPSSSIPFNAVDDLMGFEEHYCKLLEFISSTPNWAMTNFMAQCFEDPEVFNSANKKDPQLEVFQKIILQHNDLKILDFGSGKGRLIDRIKENNEVWNRIKTYDCFDINESYNDIVLSKGASGVLNDIKDIKDESYDIIILVNVLHEIHIEHWRESLLSIKKALATNGFLVIIEDNELPVGELPNDIGFLLLGKEDMKVLFGKSLTFLSPSAEEYKERIICGIIDKQNMQQITKAILKKTLENLKQNSLNNIISYRTDIKNARENQEIKIHNTKLGRLYALKANLYVNSQLAIEYLESSK